LRNILSSLRPLSFSPAVNSTAYCKLKLPALEAWGFTLFAVFDIKGLDIKVF
jgi:hypothetical protein